MRDTGGHRGLAIASATVLLAAVVLILALKGAPPPRQVASAGGNPTDMRDADGDEPRTEKAGGDEAPGDQIASAEGDAVRPQTPSAEEAAGPGQSTSPLSTIGMWLDGCTRLAPRAHAQMQVQFAAFERVLADPASSPLDRERAQNLLRMLHYYDDNWQVQLCATLFPAPEEEGAAQAAP